MSFYRRTLLKPTALGIADAILEGYDGGGRVEVRMLSVSLSQRTSTCQNDEQRRRNRFSMSVDSISVLAGSTFVVSNRTGDIDSSPSEPSGFFYKDTRRLSWVLTVNDVVPEVLSTDTLEYYFVQTGRIGKMTRFPSCGSGALNFTSGSPRSESTTYPGRWGRLTVLAERTDALSYCDIYADLFRARAAVSGKQASD